MTDSALWGRRRERRRAQVLEVHDGDSVRVMLDQGFGDTKVLWLRLAEDYAPELRDAGGPDTAAYAARWVAEGQRGGGDWPFVVETVRVRDDSHEVTTLGRYVARVLRADGADLSADVTAYVAARGYGRGTGG